MQPEKQYLQQNYMLMVNKIDLNDTAQQFNGFFFFYLQFGSFNYLSSYLQPTHRPPLKIIIPSPWSIHDYGIAKWFVIFISFCLVTPMIIPFSYDEIVNVGDALDLFCQISKGDKPISIKWSFQSFDNNSNDIQINTKSISHKANILSILNASASHSGNYTCTATNNAGSISFSTNITVNGI